MLVIIGLLAGGVLVGRDMIITSAARATVSQIESYNSAMNTFRGKYSNYLPGDIPDPYATQFGFATRGPYAGQGDGNSVIEGNWNNSSTTNTITSDAGETAMFWVDLNKPASLRITLL